MPESPTNVTVTRPPSTDHGWEPVLIPPTPPLGGGGKSGRPTANGVLACAGDIELA
jgi:hypothetical protein